MAEDVSGLYRRSSEGGPNCTAICFHGRGGDKEQGKEVGANKELEKEVEMAQEVQEGTRRRNTDAGGSLAWETFRRLRRHASQVSSPPWRCLGEVWHPGIVQVVRNSGEGPDEEVKRRGRRGEGERRRPVSSLPALPPGRGAQYQSTPLLFQLGQPVTPSTPSVIKYTSKLRGKC